MAGEKQATDGTDEVRWEVNAPGRGRSCWIERGGVFEGVETDGGLVAFEQLDLEQLEPKARKDGMPCTERPCPTVFPGDFRSCPNCGAELSPMFAAADAPWSYPGPDGDGLLNAESIEIRTIPEPLATQPDAPAGDDVVLVVAGSPRRLFALDRANSQVQVYNRQTRAWRDFPSSADFHATSPLWSWAVHAFSDGFALAGHDCFLVGRLDAMGLAVGFEVSPKEFGAPLGGPGILAEKLAFLCVTENGALSVISYDIKQRAWARECEVSGTPARFGPEAYFAAPVTTKQFGGFWATTGGYVALRAAQNAWDAVWRPWKDGFVPELQMRPMWVKKNAFWQYGLIAGNPSFEQLARSGEQRNRSDISGPHLTAGECSFSSGMATYGTPWEPNTATTILANNDSFLMPITGLKGADAVVANCGFDPNNMRFNPSSLLGDTTPKLAQLQLYRSQHLVNLNRTIRLSSLSQLQAVVFDGQLMIYDRDGACIYAWKID